MGQVYVKGSPKRYEIHNCACKVLDAKVLQNWLVEYKDFDLPERDFNISDISAKELTMHGSGGPEGIFHFEGRERSSGVPESAEQLIDLCLNCQTCTSASMLCGIVQPFDALCPYWNLSELQTIEWEGAPHGQEGRDGERRV